MKICIIGPGILTIPPTGWGAVEILIDDYRKNLEKLGHEVFIVNTKIPQHIVGITNALNPDFVHIQYDDFAYIIPHIECKNVAITSHYGYVEQPDRWESHYRKIFWDFVNSNAKLFCLSPGIAEIYRKANVPEDRIFVTPNGVRTDLFRYTENPKYPERSIYLAKIDYRKRQHIYQNIPDLYFAGGCHDNRFDTSNPRYLGHWSKSVLYDSLTNYANLVLLSDGEAHPLVCMEALSAGLGLVISEYASANLDTSLPFIDVVSESKIHDLDYVRGVLENNRKVSVKMRKEIREYAMNFDWERVVKEKYVKSVEKILEGNNEQ